MTSRIGLRTGQRPSPLGRDAGRIFAWGVAGLSALLGLSSCTQSDGLELIAEAQVSCTGEEPTSEMRAAGPTMLPGRVCGACHRTGGPAQNSPWTLSGTVYNSVSSPCNSDFRQDITVEILYARDSPTGIYRRNDLQPGGRLKTNAVGNFFTSGRFIGPMKIRIIEGDPDNPTKQQIMATEVGYDENTGQTARVDCNFCHYQGGPNGSPGRIYMP